MMMVPMQQPSQMMMMPQPQIMQPMTMQPTGPTSATGAKAAKLIEEQLHPSTTSSESSAVPVSILDVAPEVKPTESSSASSESSGSSEGKRVIKLS
jgi:hypothetical protein